MRRGLHRQNAPGAAQRLIDFTVNRDRQIAWTANEQSAASWTKQTVEWRARSKKVFS